ncbi:MAG: hypothetical protein ACR2J7_07025 [Luteimonas sp.]
MGVVIMLVAATGVPLVDGYPVFVDVVLKPMVQMALVNVVDMFAVAHSHVAAVVSGPKQSIYSGADPGRVVDRPGKHDCHT